MSMPTITEPEQQKRRWSPHEDELLLRLLPTTSIEDISKHLSGRTLRAIDARARRLSQEPKQQYAKSSEWLTPEGLKRMQEMASTMMGYQIAMELGIPVQTLAKWKQRYPEIREAIDRGNAVRKGAKPWQQVTQQPKQKPVKNAAKAPAAAVVAKSKLEPKTEPKPAKSRELKRQCATCEWARKLVDSGRQVLCIWPTRCEREEGGHAETNSPGGPKRQPLLPQRISQPAHHDPDGQGVGARGAA